VNRGAGNIEARNVQYDDALAVTRAGHRSPQWKRQGRAGSDNRRRYGCVKVQAEQPIPDRIVDLVRKIEQLPKQQDEQLDGRFGDLTRRRPVITFPSVHLVGEKRAWCCQSCREMDKALTNSDSCCVRPPAS
jgi:hypothetical protein